MRRWLLAAPAAASEVRYEGRPLESSYSGPILIDNSQIRYTGADRLSSSTDNQLLNNAPAPAPPMFSDGFETGSTTIWSSTLR